MQCDFDMNLLCWGSGELGQTGHGRPGDIGPEEAHLTEFTLARLGRAKLLACGSSHSIVITGTGPSSSLYWLLSFIAHCGCLNAIHHFWYEFYFEHSILISMICVCVCEVQSDTGFMRCILSFII